MATVPGARGHANKLPGSGADVEVEDGAAGAAAIADDSGRAEEGKEEVDGVLAGLGVQHALGLGVHQQLSWWAWCRLEPSCWFGGWRLGGRLVVLRCAALPLYSGRRSMDSV